MSIIVEGPDAAGKTSLIRAIYHINQTAITYSSGGAPKNWEMLIKYCETQYEVAKHRQMLLDRITPISQQIYHEGLFGDSYLCGWLEKILQLPRVIIVYCRPPTDILMMSEKHEWKDYDSEEWKQQVLSRQHEYIKLYDLLMQNIPHIAYDYTYEEAPTLMAALAASLTNDEIFDKLWHIIEKGRDNVNQCV